MIEQFESKKTLHMTKTRDPMIFLNRTGIDAKDGKQGWYDAKRIF
jgi:hypothetical protein